MGDGGVKDAGIGAIRMDRDRLNDTRLFSMV
jgi:hypothetical protein